MKKREDVWFEILSMSMVLNGLVSNDGTTFIVVKQICEKSLSEIKLFCGQIFYQINLCERWVMSNDDIRAYNIIRVLYISPISDLNRFHISRIE